MPFRPSEIERLLQNKFGFERVSEKQDHRWYSLRLEGMPTITTKVSHSRGDVGSQLESRIAKQLRVRNPFFKEMMSCTKSRDDYEHQVRDAPFPPWNERLV